MNVFLETFLGPIFHVYPQEVTDLDIVVQVS